MRLYLMAAAVGYLALWPLLSGAAEKSRGDVRLSNQHVTIAFARPQEGGGISSIRNEQGFEFLNRVDRPVLWRMELRRIPLGKPKDPFIKLSMDPERNDIGASRDAGGSETIFIDSTVNAAHSVKETDGGLQLTWSGVDVGAEGGVLDVTVDVRLAKNDPFVRTRTSFSNRSRNFTVFSVGSPLVQGIYPSDGRSELDRLASPVYLGRLQKDPSRNGVFGATRRYQPNRSGHSMQFDAWYHDGHGLYLGVFDGQENVKRYELTATPADGVGWGALHIPDNMKQVPQNWTTPYDTVIRTYKGDWYDACQIYREWALKQHWTSQGPLSTRESTPKWFKEIDCWFMVANFGPKQEAMYDEGLLKDLKGLNIGVWVGETWRSEPDLRHSHHTPDYTPLRAKGLDQVKRAKAHGFPVQAYVQAVCWDLNAPSFKARDGLQHMVENFEGQKVVWNLEPGMDVATAFPGDVWRDTLGATIELMAKDAGFQSAYMDSGNHGGTYLNFNPKYGGGGGGNYYIKGQQKLLAEAKARARKHDPGFCLTSESFWEGNLAELDGILAVNTTYQFLHKDHVLAIPMAPAVYHDYTSMFATWSDKGDVEQPGARGFLAKYGQTFVWGIKPGWEQANVFLTFKNGDIARESSIHRYRAYHAAHKFLVYGKMLREPQISTPLAEVPLKWGIAWGPNSYDITLPAVLRSMWRATDGSLGLVLFNISDEEQAVTFQLDDPEYGLNVRQPGPHDDRKGSGQPVLKSIYPEQPLELTGSLLATGGMTVTTRVPPRSPMVIELRP